MKDHFKLILFRFFWVCQPISIVLATSWLLLPITGESVAHNSLWGFFLGGIIGVLVMKEVWYTHLVERPFQPEKSARLEPFILEGPKK